MSETSWTESDCTDFFFDRSESFKIQLTSFNILLQSPSWVLEVLFLPNDFHDSEGSVQKVSKTT